MTKTPEETASRKKGLLGPMVSEDLIHTSGLEGSRSSGQGACVKQRRSPRVNWKAESEGQMPDVRVKGMLSMTFLSH